MVSGPGLDHLGKGPSATDWIIRGEQGRSNKAHWTGTSREPRSHEDTEQDPKVKHREKNASASSRPPRI